MAPTFTPEELASEEWRTIPGVAYREVSNLGRYRLTRHGGTGRAGVPTIGAIDRKRGYRMVGVGNGRAKLVHALVAAAFIGPRPDGFHVCHNDGNPENNRVSNLRYDTAKANAADCWRHGTRTSAVDPYVALLGTVPDSQVAALAGRTVQQVAQYRRLRGIASFRSRRAA